MDLTIENEPHDDLIDRLYGDEDQQLPEFTVKDIETAGNVVAVIVMAEQRMEAAKAEAKRLKEKIDARLAEILEDDERLVNIKAALIKPWAETEILSMRTKTIKTFSGNIKFKTVKGKTINNDNTKTVQWYEENYPEMVRTTITKALDATKAKEFFRASGEKAPTVEFEDSSDRMYIEEAK